IGTCVGAIDAEVGNRCPRDLPTNSRRADEHGREEWRFNTWPAICSTRSSFASAKRICARSPTVHIATTHDEGVLRGKLKVLHLLMWKLGKTAKPDGGNLTI